MTGERDGKDAGLRYRVVDPGRDGDGGGSVGSPDAETVIRQLLQDGSRADGLSIAERRAGALMARADEPQGARRVIINLGLASGQPFSEIANLRLNEALYIAKRLKNG